MTNFFKNPNANSVVVDRVPCAFAKNAQGTHYTLVIFDDKQNIMYVGSECEHLHGEAVQAMHEMGGVTCFAVTDEFRKALNKVKTFKGKTIDNYSGAISMQTKIGSPLLKAAFNTAAQTMIGRHNKRVPGTAREERPKVYGIKGEALQHVVHRLTGHILKLPKTVKLGRYADKVTNHVMQDESYLDVFTVREYDNKMPLVWGAQEIPPGVYLSLEPASENRTLAIRDPKTGTWYMDNDRILAFASRNHNCGTGQGTVSDRTCIFCGESYERMSKHLQGAKHKERVLEVVKLVCKATTPTGLRMINNPKHKSAFFR